MAKKQSKTNSIAIFEGQQIRRHWDEEKELWYFAIPDVIGALTNSDNSQVYWRVMKKRLIEEGPSETVTKCNALKMLAPDGKPVVSKLSFQKTQDQKKLTVVI